MLTLAILSILGAATWTFVVLIANGMAAAPSKRIQGIGTIYLAWAGSLVLWAGYILG